MSEFNFFEKEIKKVVLNHLYLKGKLSEGVAVISELTIDSFSRRVDLAILNDKKIVAYEIKSDADSLYRLSGQLEKYRQYFDKVVVVTTSKHLKSIVSMVADDVEIWEVLEQRIIIRKKGRLSKIDSKIKYLDLLKVDEMKRLVKIFNIKTNGGGKEKIKNIIIENINNISHERLKLFVIHSISLRFNLTSTVFLDNINSSSKVTLNSLRFLSPYIVRGPVNSLNEASILEQSK